MSFNLGAFAGAAAQSGMNTYQTLEAIESQKKRDEMVALQTQQLRDELKGKEALRSAIAEQGGEKTFTPNFGGTGGMDTNDVAPTPVQMSASERRAAIEQRAIAGGADPEAAMRYTATRRTADLSNAFDTTMDKLHKESADRMSSIKATAESGGLKGLAETFGPELKKAFGHEIQFKPVPGAAGEIVAMDGKKVVARYSSLGDATQALEGLVGQEFETKFSKAMLQPGMFGSSAELANYMNKQAELKNQNITAQAAARNAATNEMVGRAHAGYYSAAAGNVGKGGKNATGSLYDTAKTMVAEGSAPSVESAMLMLKGKQARDAFGSAWEKTRLELVKQDMPPEKIEAQKQALQLEFGFAPQAFTHELMSGKGVDAKGKKRDLTLADVEAFNQRYPSSAVDPEQLPWVKKEKARAAAIAAIPTK